MSLSLMLQFRIASHCRNCWRDSIMSWKPLLLFSRITPTPISTFPVWHRLSQVWAHAGHFTNRSERALAVMRSLPSFYAMQNICDTFLPHLERGEEYGTEWINENSRGACLACFLRNLSHPIRKANIAFHQAHLYETVAMRFTCLDIVEYFGYGNLSQALLLLLLSASAWDQAEASLLP